MAGIGRSNHFWGMMLEKAFAKVKGTYTMADGGFMENGIRSLVGCPVVSYTTDSISADDAFTALKAANDLNYIMGTGTTGGADSDVNSCNVAMSHAYSLIAAFELKTGGTVDHKLYMIRNPWGQAFFNGTWSQSDTTSWTSDYISQVPHGVNPLTSATGSGIFFVSHTDFLTCF